MPALRFSYAPLRARWLRALAEAAAGHAILLFGSAVIGGSDQAEVSILRVMFTALAWVWLIVWPAWRLRPVRPRSWWRRIVFGLPRALVMGLALVVVNHVLVAITSYPGANPLFDGRASLSASASVITVVFFLVARTSIVLLVSVRRRVRRRLRWQLMVSHVLVIVLTLTTITAVGSVVGIQLVLLGTRPNAVEMANSVAADLRLGRDMPPFNLSAVRSVFAQIESRKLPPGGEPPLAGLARTPLLPTRILLLDLQGNILTGIRDGNAGPAPVAKRTWFDLYSSRELWSRIRFSAVAGEPASFTLPRRTNRNASEFALGITPIRDRSGRVTNIVAVQVLQLGLSGTQYVQGAIAIFGASTVVVILATSIPVLALSFLFSYLMARGLTRRLESVSQVTTAIAAGNLSRRAPIDARNEIGRLAVNVNRMAGHLEDTMGELHSARARAVEALRTRQELVASISHELRTPLAVIRAHLETVALRRPAVAGTMASPPDADILVPPATMHALQGETERLSALIDDLFALSRVQSGGLEVQCEPVDIAAVVDEVAAVLRPLAWQEGSVALSVEAPPGLPNALADADRLRQIISNLVRNAVRHTPDGGIIALSVAAEEQWIIVSVADTGEGIPPEHVPHIFERFYRVDEARSRETGGAGLGLAIVNELVELMGGHVTIESTVGEGTVFRVFLPTAGH